jgi:hypothetical protein
MRQSVWLRRQAMGVQNWPSRQARVSRGATKGLHGGHRLTKRAISRLCVALLAKRPNQSPLTSYPRCKTVTAMTLAPTT